MKRWLGSLSEELRYSKSHEWIQRESNGIFTVGITDFAQEQMGDLVYVELPDVDSRVVVNDTVAVLESVKTASDVYSPFMGKIVAINKKLQEDPSLISRSPYGEGWIYRIKADNENEFDKLLSSESYKILTKI
ncbi:glycine cleavage system protein GcvH [Coxiella endosymbiont of Amblyomma sculptum]|uniref:glycine cleavage system protein GcvH n=1 Tax=Coxiella endosymbiont of Amblyomma sculptum TaxID=2487929 RepID=UPI00132EE151|nr:glycine cleavage system protein GcvH [Coxiella endosymbiont of Amblyomma sculptum]QHG92257.1 glycine cleavage system protein GcvH [Coxiella endosymbiont of Amblyomma sculptum]